MTESPPAANVPEERILPVIGGSEAEALNSTHIFLVEATSLDNGQWAMGDEGIEARSFTGAFRLVEVLKGELDLPAGSDFNFTGRQFRPDPYEMGDVPGCWSAVEISVGETFMISASGSSRLPDDLMQDGRCRGVFQSDYADDIRLARRAERLYIETRHANEGDDANLRAVEALIELSAREGQQARDMYARYFWYRVQAVFSESEGAPLMPLLGLVRDPQMNIKFRADIVPAITDALLDIEPDPELVASTLSVWFELLLQKEALEMHEDLVYSGIYDLIFTDDKPQDSVEKLVEPSVDRRAVIDALEKFEDNDRADQIASWVGR